MGEKHVVEKDFRAGFVHCHERVNASLCYRGDDASDEDGRSKQTKIYHVEDDVDVKPSVRVTYDKRRIVVKALYPVSSSGAVDDDLDSFNRLV